MNVAFSLGQRWISSAEPELGLGLVSELSGRQVSVTFRKSGQVRTYSVDNAPLERVIFDAGDEVLDEQGATHKVLAIENVDGLLVYATKDETGSEQQLVETRLADEIRLNQPVTRLLNSQTDHISWFELRRNCLEALQFKFRSPWLGLCSARTQLLAHQVFIAGEVSSRYAPRVLLSDEVGLGKTIEACLIMQQQLFSGLCSRVLIMVPETLQHQWLVELLRKFSLQFSMFDQQRCEELLEEGINPFDSEQLVLCSRDMLVHNEEIFALVCESQWDLLIVDEAHHIRSPAANAATGNDEEGIAYRQLQYLGRLVPGILLLTATPDQLGQQSHFDLLHILDPDRFPDFLAFCEEQSLFSQIAEIIEQLESISLVSESAQLTRLCHALADSFNEQDVQEILQELPSSRTPATQREKLRKELISAILDRHGTGRLQFRNTRKVVSGFPKRIPIAYSLPCPDNYQGQTLQLCPEVKAGPQWLSSDPRIPWLCDLLQQYRGHKVLLICADTETAISLEQHLRLKSGFRSAVFHELMSILERDRAAAYFAQADQGADLLVCSEIGSEGRNFQFSQHLVLFDLPVNPDLLEQRIGRLDRIGQQKEIFIHIPFINETLQAVLYQWYQDGLDAFDKPAKAGFKVFEFQQEKLRGLMQTSWQDIAATIPALIAEARELNEKFLTELDHGRDRLLELNSFNPAGAESWMSRLDAYEKQQSPFAFTMQLLDQLGLDTEINSDKTTVVQPASDMVIDTFPAVPDYGMTFTCDRNTALHREDVQFVTWHHPLVNQGIDIILQNDFGKASAAIRKKRHGEPQNVLLESLYSVNIQAESTLHSQQFLPDLMVRTLVDRNGQNLSAQISSPTLDTGLEHLDRQHLREIFRTHRSIIGKMDQLNRLHAEKSLPALVHTARCNMEEKTSIEIKRLKALARINSAIRTEEIAFLENQVRELDRAFADTSLVLEAVRLIFVT